MSLNFSPPQNQALLASLGFDKPTLEPKEKIVKKAPAAKKRKVSEDTSEDSPAPREVKAPRASLADSATESGVRRSSRNAGKTVDYKNEIVDRTPVRVAYSSGVKGTENTGRMGREDGKRTHDPYVGLHWQTASIIDCIFRSIGRRTALFRESRSGRGGSSGGAAVRMPYMRTWLYLCAADCFLTFPKALGRRYFRRQAGGIQRRP